MKNGRDHCPAMKGIEMEKVKKAAGEIVIGRDHCPAMKGIEMIQASALAKNMIVEETTAPQ